MFTKNTKGQPWYFLLALLPNILSPIWETFFSAYFGEKEAEAILNTTVSVSLRYLFPTILGLILLIIFIINYIIQLRNDVKRQVTPNELEEIQKHLKNYVDSFEYIQSIQAYQAWIKNDSNCKYIKVCYLTGAADERIDINSIMQSYFYFPYSIYKKITTTSAYYDQYQAATEPTKQLAYKNNFMKAGQELCDEILTSLNNLQTEDEIGLYHCELYRTFVRFFSAITGKAVVRVLENENIENALRKKRKSGLLGAIILNDVYVFRNENSINKTDRIYFAFPYDVKRHIIFLGSINSSCFPSNDENDIATYCSDIAKSSK